MHFTRSHRWSMHSCNSLLLVCIPGQRLGKERRFVPRSPWVLFLPPISKYRNWTSASSLDSSIISFVLPSDPPVPSLNPVSAVFILTLWHLHFINCIYLYMSCVCVCVHSVAQLCLTFRNSVAHQSLSMRFSRQEYWSGLPFLTLGELPNPGIKPTSFTFPALAGRFCTTDAPVRL